MYPTLNEAVRLSRRTGLFFLCSTCKKMWEGLALGKDGCTGVNCGSIVLRRDFPEYSGVIKDFSSVCFVCGSEDVLAYAKLEGSDKQFGMCQHHLEIVDDYVAKDKKNLFESKKIIIFPNPNKAMDRFKYAKHTV